jgi:hypothetical protein
MLRRISRFVCPPRSTYIRSLRRQPGGSNRERRELNSATRKKGCPTHIRLKPWPLAIDSPRDRVARRRRTRGVRAKCRARARWRDTRAVRSAGSLGEPNGALPTGSLWTKRGASRSRPTAGAALHGISPMAASTCMSASPSHSPGYSGILTASRTCVRWPERGRARRRRTGSRVACRAGGSGDLGARPQYFRQRLEEFPRSDTDAPVIGEIAP